jgi:hypothetical protein
VSSNVNDKKLRFYIPPEWLLDKDRKLIPLATSLLGQNPKPSSSWSHRLAFDLTMDFTAKCEASPTAENSDFILFPFNWRNSDSTKCTRLDHNWAKPSRRDRPPILIHGSTADILKQNQVLLPIKNYIYLNQALVKGREPSFALAPPFFIPDLVSLIGQEWEPITDLKMPSVGFCGVAGPLKTKFSTTKVFDYVRLLITYCSFINVNPERLLRTINNNSKHAYRVRLMNNLGHSDLIRTSFILRSQGGLVDNSYYRKADKSAYVGEYINNIYSSLYTICCRGTENYSVRLYETLCLGRIPIIVDTDIRLPFDGDIEYSSNCVYISPMEIAKASSILKDWHYSRTPSKLEEIQKANRQIWLSYLSHEAYYPRLSEYLASSLPPHALV